MLGSVYGLVYYGLKGVNVHKVANTALSCYELLRSGGEVFNNHNGIVPYEERTINASDSSTRHVVGSFAVGLYGEVDDGLEANYVSAFDAEIPVGSYVVCTFKMYVMGETEVITNLFLTNFDIEGAEIVVPAVVVKYDSTSTSGKFDMCMQELLVEFRVTRLSVRAKFEVTARTLISPSIYRIRSLAEVRFMSKVMTWNAAVD
uniref:Uncharacterized protein n=1 Tax=Atrato Sobemo-like virus 3 TaxID=2689349 RepID=A0A6B9KNX4_9VIRU|nr:hypothetical protein [Atrato Sobemo-like virus 3]QHA33886.1 hypothetical protein [Atrato Sobemo-like virus 3]